MRCLILRRAPVAWLIIAVVALVLSACSNTPQAAPAATVAAAPLPADWQRVEVPGMSLALPPEWAVTTPDAAEADAAIAAMGAQNPALQTVLDQGRAALASGQVQLIAYDLAPDRLDATGIPANLRIGRQSYPDAPEPQQVGDVNEQDLRSTEGFSQIQRDQVTIGDVVATRLRSQLQITDLAGQPLTLAIEQYLVVEGSDVYVLTFTAPQAQQSTYRTMFDQIMGTLRILSS